LPGDAQSPLKAGQRCYQNADLPRLDLLKSARVQRNHFRHLLLGQPLATAFPADVRAEHLQKRLLFIRDWHALLGREWFLTTTAQ
jgi:hypothetical protein